MIAWRRCAPLSGPRTGLSKIRTHGRMDRHSLALLQMVDGWPPPSADSETASFFSWEIVSLCFVILQSGDSSGFGEASSDFGVGSEVDLEIRL